MTAVIAEVDKGIYIEPSKMTVRAWLDTWITEYTGGIKELTKTQYKQICRVLLNPHFGAVELSALKPHMIQKMYNDLFKGGTSPKTIKNINGVFHKALQQAVLLPARGERCSVQLSHAHEGRPCGRS